MKEIRLLHAADLHLDSAFESLSAEASAERREGQRKLLFKMGEIADKYGVSAVLLSGDVFDSNSVMKETERSFNSAFGTLNCPVLIAPGNHDPYSANSAWEAMRLPENVYIFKSTDVEYVAFPGVPARFWGAGFRDAFSPALLKDFSAPETDDDIPDILVIHGDTGSAAADYNPISRDDLIKSGMDYVALGHVHARTPVMKAGKTSYAYPGCPEGRGFDETGEKGAYLVTISDSGVTAEFMPLGGVRYEIISVDVSENDIFKAVSEALEGLSDKDCVRVILKGECETAPDAVQLRKQLEGRFSELQIRDETTRKLNVWAQLGANTLSGVFVDKLYMMYKNADEKEQKKIELAARYGLSAIENGGDLV